MMNRMGFSETIFLFFLALVIFGPKKLPEIARQQREADKKLTALHEAIIKLALTHHALAAEAQHNNPESLKEKLGELSDAGSNLGKFYSSLPSN